jgi:hypothetical protein
MTCSNEYIAEAGDSFYSFIRKVQDTMWLLNQATSICTFNGLIINVSNNSNIDDLSTIYNLKHRLRQLGG